jgi:superfamily II DNA or RNA helicase
MAGKNDWFGKKIVIGTVHSIAKDKFGERFKDYFGTIVFDECDNTVPPATFAPAAGMFYAKYRIGMTASRDRADQTHVVFEKHIVEAEINCETSNTMTPVAVYIEFNESSGELPYGIKGLPRVGTLTTMLARNPRRNAVIARYTLMCYSERRPTLVISNRKGQLKELRRLLIQQGVLPHEIGYYTASIDGKTFSKEELKYNADHCQILLGTYGMIGRGTDIPRLSALILATPQADLRQTKGRIERFIAGKQQPVIIDMLDNYYTDCINSARKRYAQYEESKMEVRLVDAE